MLKQLLNKIKIEVTATSRGITYETRNKKHTYKVENRFFNVVLYAIIFLIK